MINEHMAAQLAAMKDLIRDLIKEELRVDVKVEDCDASGYSHYVTVSLYLGEEYEPFHTSGDFL